MSSIYQSEDDVAMLSLYLLVHLEQKRNAH